MAHGEQRRIVVLISGSGTADSPFPCRLSLLAVDPRFKPAGPHRRSQHPRTPRRTYRPGVL